MDEIIINFFQNLGWIGEFLLMTIELICAVLFSGLIGYEREVKGAWRFTIRSIRTT